MAQVWEGNSTVAKTGWNGEIWDGILDFMFDDKPQSIVHSKGTNGGGPSVVFNSPIVGLPRIF
jgi:hypothetical protein